MASSESQTLRIARLSSRASAAASALGGSVRRCGSLPHEFQSAVARFVSLISTFGTAMLALLLVFVVHQLFLWVDREPEAAFDRAALLFEVAEIAWDTTSVVWNAGVDVLNAGVLPLWNSGVHYVVEPGVVLVLEVFSLVFLRHHWEGVVDETAFPYNGFDCLADEQAARWCGNYAYYAAQLQAAERAPHYVDDSQTFAARRLEAAPPDQVFVFGTATARRLAQLDRRRAFQAPVFDTADVTSSLDAFSDFFLTVVPSLMDVAFGVGGDILQTSFSVLADGVLFLLNNAIMVLKMMVKSGSFATVVALGVDFLVISLTEIALPMLFAGIDLLMCIIDFVTPSGWAAQFECVELRCFKGPDVLSDMFVFIFVPVAMERFAAIMDASLNSRTGKRLFSGFTTGSFTSKGRTRNPDTGEPIDNTEPAGAGQRNPLFEFELADSFEHWLPPPGAKNCASCFNCKVRGASPVGP